MKEKVSETGNGGEVLPPENQSTIAKFFGDPYAERTAEEDPVFRYFSQNWRRILTVIVAAVAGFYAYNVFRDTNIASQQASGDAFMRIQHEFEGFRELRTQVVSAKPEDKERLEKQLADTKRRLEESLNALGNMREPYAELSKVYRGFLAAEVGEGGNAKFIDPLAWQRIADKNSSQRFIEEVAAFGWARSQMDSDTNGAEARKLLKSLASDGAYVYVGAGLSLAAISVTPEERKEALAILQSILTAHPEQDSLLKDEISRLR